MIWKKHHQDLNGHEFEQTQGDSGEQRSLVYFNSWGQAKRVEMTLATEQQQQQ